MKTAESQKQAYRIGMIVPSSNTTMETEIPALLHSLHVGDPIKFTFHSSRVRLLQVTPAALQRMNETAGEAVDSLCDAQVDSIMYACLVATMYGGKSSVLSTEERLTKQAHTTGVHPSVITSAGALVTALNALNAKRVTMITPYKKELTEKVADTLREYGITVVQTHSLEVSDNVAVGRLDPLNLLSVADRMDLSGSDALIISACVQMPSLAIIHEAEKRYGIPVVSAATASAYTLLQQLGINPRIPNAGSLLMNNN